MSKFFKHETANISENANIGEGCKIWINVQIRENASVGENCFLSKDVYIDHGVQIGTECKIQNGVSVYHGVSWVIRYLLVPMPVSQMTEYLGFLIQNGK